MPEKRAAAGAEFGARLRAYRESAGLTQEALAERAGLSVNAIGLLERGERQRPYPHTISALAAALELDDEERAALAAAVHTPAGEVAAPETAPLPGPLTPLVGREDDLALVSALLQSARLVTLTGPGGVGKTRLALAVARGVRDRAVASGVTDPVAFVPLAGLTDPSLVVSAVAQAVGARGAGGDVPGSALAAALRGRQLLVLDNLEHLLPAAPTISTLLAACPTLTILATSRAPLRIHGEREYQVRPLATPSFERVPHAAEVAQAPAVRLFVERATAVTGAFALADDNAAAVAAICRRLDGLPLAIELAAARTRLLSPTALLGRLDQALPLLSQGSRDLPARHQTLRETIAWSYNLLSPSEQTLFRRLAVFAGGFTLAAAEAIDDRRSAVNSSATLDQLTTLVEHSLLTASSGNDGEPRFVMLETIREFARERALAHDELETAQRAHVTISLRLAEQAESHLPGPSPEPWLAALDRDYDNLRAALDWLALSGDWEELLRLAGALWIYWFSRSTIEEGRRWLARGLASLPDGSLPVRAKATIGAGMLATAQGAFDQATSLLTEGEMLADSTGDQRGVGMARFGLGIAAQDTGDPDQAQHQFASALAAFRSAGDDVMVATTRTNLGLVTARCGDVTKGVAFLEQAIAEHAALGFRFGTALAQRFLGQVELRRGDLGRAATLFRESLEIDWTHAHRWHIANALEGLAEIALATGHLETAARTYAAAAALRAAAGVPLEPALQETHHRCLAQLRASLGEDAFAVAWQDGERQPLAAVIADAQAIVTG